MSRGLSRAAASVTAPASASATETLAAELHDVEVRYGLLENTLAGLKRATATKTRERRVAGEEQRRELAASEEAAAAICSRRCTDLGTQAEFREELRKADARHVAVEQAVASRLYWRWKLSFEAHLRASGSFEDFRDDEVIRDLYDFVPTDALDVPLREEERLRLEHARLDQRLAEAEAEELSLGSEVAAATARGRTLRADVRRAEEDNLAWRRGQLADGPRSHETRVRWSKLESLADGVRLELQASLAHVTAGSGHLERRRHEALEFQNRLVPCEEQVVVLEKAAAQSEWSGYQVHKRVEEIDYQLSEHRHLQVWQEEVAWAERDSYEMRKEALTFLRETAAERNATKDADAGLSALTACLRERRQDALALDGTYQQTARQFESTARDLDRLGRAHEELQSEYLCTLRRLGDAEANVEAESLGLPRHHHNPSAGEWETAPPTTTIPCSTSSHGWRVKPRSGKSTNEDVRGPGRGRGREVFDEGHAWMGTSPPQALPRVSSCHELGVGGSGRVSGVPRPMPMRPGTRTPL